MTVAAVYSCGGQNTRMNIVSLNGITSINVNGFQYIYIDRHGINMDVDVLSAYNICMHMFLRLATERTWE